MGRLVLAAMAALAAVLTLAAVAQAQPNIVVVMTDDQTLRDVETMDNVQRTLAARGTTFENFFATFPLCCPSRATFLTGQYAHNHGVKDNHPPLGGDEAFADPHTTLAPALAAEGYRTGLIGKYMNGHTVADGVPPGWDEWRAAQGNSSQAYNYTLHENGKEVFYGDAPDDFRTNVLKRKAIDFIEAGGMQPFFLVVTPSAPHVEGGPPTPGPDYQGRFDDEPLPQPPSFNEPDVSDKPSFIQSEPLTDERIADMRTHYRGRLASLVPVDQLVNQMVGRLRQLDLLDNTYVIFTSDNGFLLGEHRLRGKIHLYEESTHVPLLVRGPGVPVGVTRKRMTANIDLAPTILDAANAAALRPVDGRSLLPLARDPGITWRKGVLLENANSVALRTRRYMYAEHPEGERELYDLDADPFQLQSLHSDPSQGDRIESLSGRLADIRDCAGTECP